MKIENRETLEYLIFDILAKTKALSEAKEAASEVWENRLTEAEAEATACEDLILFYDTPEMARRIRRAYNRVRHYHYIYRKLARECEELEEAVEGLNKASYWI